MVGAGIVLCFGSSNVVQAGWISDCDNAIKKFFGREPLSPPIPNWQPEGLESLQHEPLETKSAILSSLKYPFGKTFKIMLGASPTLPDVIRERAMQAAKTGNALEVLEFGEGIPTNSLLFTNPKTARMYYGDILTVGTDGKKHEPPRAKITFITPRNDLLDLISDRENKLAEKWDRKLALNEFGGVLAFDGINGEAENYLARYESAEKNGSIRVISGNWEEDLRLQTAEKPRYDLAFSYSIPRVKNRLQVLFALQRLLKPEGTAFIPIQTWSLNLQNQTVDRVHLSDRVKLRSGEVLKLQDFLAAKYPDQFRVVHYAGNVETLLIKGGGEAHSLGAFQVAETGTTTEEGYPILLWTEL